MDRVFIGWGYASREWWPLVRLEWGGCTGGERSSVRRRLGPTGRVRSRRGAGFSSRIQVRSRTCYETPAVSRPWKWGGGRSGTALSSSAGRAPSPVQQDRRHPHGRQRETDPRDREQGEGGELDRQALALLIVEAPGLGGHPAAGEPPGVRPVVDPRQGEAHQEHHHRPLPELRGHRRGPAPAPVDDERGEQAEDASRRPDRGRAASQVREQETHRPGDAEHHERARRAVDFGDGGAEVPDPHQVEEDVQQSAVEIDRGEERPPPALPPRQPAGHSELVEGARPGRENREEAVEAEDLPGLERQRRDVKDHAARDDEGDEIEAPPEPALDGRSVAEEPGPPRPAERAFLLVDADQLPALRADHRALGLPDHYGPA